MTFRLEPIIFIVPLIGFFLFAGMIALLINRRTRPFAIAILLGGPLLMVLGVYWMARSVVIPHAATVEMETPRGVHITMNDSSEPLFPPLPIPNDRKVKAPAPRKKQPLYGPVVTAPVIKKAEPPFWYQVITHSQPKTEPKVMTPTLVTEAPADQRLAQADAANSQNDPFQDKPVDRAPPPIASAVPTPSVQVAQPNPKPDWVDHPPPLVNDQYQVVLASGLYKSGLECEGAMNLAIVDAEHELLESLEPGASRYGVRCEFSGIPGGAVRNVLVLPATIRAAMQPSDYWWERTESESVGPMQQLHARVRFDIPELRGKLRAWHVSERLNATGMIVLGVLGCLAIAWGLLKIDVVTRGAYRGRMAIVSLLILGAAVGSLLMVAG